MHIVISNQSGKPIYEQIAEQVKALIISGELGEGDALPSMRLLAKELRISVITTKRAFDDLERDGFIYTVQGKGSFVAAKNKEMVREEHLRRIEQCLSEAMKIAREGGISAEELVQMFEILLKGE